MPANSAGFCENFIVTKTQVYFSPRDHKNSLWSRKKLSWKVFHRIKSGHYFCPFSQIQKNFQGVFMRFYRDSFLANIYYQILNLENIVGLNAGPGPV